MKVSIRHGSAICVAAIVGQSLVIKAIFNPLAFQRSAYWGFLTLGSLLAFLTMWNLLALWRDEPDEYWPVYPGEDTKGPPFSIREAIRVTGFSALICLSVATFGTFGVGHDFSNDPRYNPG